MSPKLYSRHKNKYTYLKHLPYPRPCFLHQLDVKVPFFLCCSRTRSYKKDDEPLLNLTGAMSRCSSEKVLMCTQKRELEFSAYSMNKTGGRRKMLITRANAASWLSSSSAPSQSLLKSLLWGRIALWLWVHVITVLVKFSSCVSLASTQRSRVPIPQRNEDSRKSV